MAITRRHVTWAAIITALVLAAYTWVWWGILGVIFFEALQDAHWYSAPQAVWDFFSFVTILSLAILALGWIERKVTHSPRPYRIPGDPKATKRRGGTR